MPPHLHHVARKHAAVDGALGRLRPGRVLKGNVRLAIVPGADQRGRDGRVSGARHLDGLHAAVAAALVAEVVHHLAGGRGRGTATAEGRQGRAGEASGTDREAKTKGEKAVQP